MRKHTESSRSQGKQEILDTSRILFCRSVQVGFFIIKQHIHKGGNLGSVNHLPCISEENISLSSIKSVCTVSHKQTFYPCPILTFQVQTVPYAAWQHAMQKPQKKRSSDMHKKKPWAEGKSRYYLNRTTHHLIRAYVAFCLQTRFPISPSKKQSSFTELLSTQKGKTYRRLLL